MIAWPRRNAWSRASRPRSTSLRRGRATRSSAGLGDGRVVAARARQPRLGPFPLARGHRGSARGLGAARLGKPGDARAASQRLAALEANAAHAGEELFARNIRVLRLEVDAWTAQLEGEPNIAIERMQEAATLETSTPKHAVTPAPTIPAHEQLGDLWMTQGQPARALEAYRRSLGLYPNRFGSLRGVSRAERALAQ